MQILEWMITKSHKPVVFIVKGYLVYLKGG